MMFDQLQMDRSFEAYRKDSCWEDDAKCRGADRRSSSCFEINRPWDQDTLRSTPSKVEQPNRDGDSVAWFRERH